MDRQELIEVAIRHGKNEKSARKTNTKSLENFVAKRTNSTQQPSILPRKERIKRNTNFRLGLNRQQLIEAATTYGKDIKSAKKANTKTLENFVIKELTGKKKRGQKFPELSPEDKRYIHSNANAWGVYDALKHLTYKVEKLSGLRNENNFLRLTITDSFSLFYDGAVRPHHVDEIISRLPQLENTQVDSDMINISPYYRNLYIDYADELEERENNTKTS